MRDQKGQISVLSLLGVVACGLTLWIGVTVGPSFVTSYQVQKLVEEARADSSLIRGQEAKIYGWFKVAFRREDLWSFKPSEIIFIEGSGESRRITYGYEVRKPLFEDIELVMTFGDKAE